MNAVLMPGIFQILSMVLMGGGVGMPIGIPPAAEDPAMARAAPKECLFYLTWSGMAAPDPHSSNQTEQLLAEQEVQQSLKLLEDQIVAGLRAESAADPQAAAMIEDVRTVAKAVLTSPTAIFISKIELAKNGPPDVHGGAVVNLGQQAPEIDKALGRIESQSLGHVANTEAGSTWHRLPLGPNDPKADRGGSLQWAVRERYLIIGLGDGEAESIAARAWQDPPEWLQQLRQRLTVPRPANLIYVNVAELLKLGAGNGPDFMRTLDGLGLAQIKSVASVTGLDDTGCVTRTHLAFTGKPKGLLAIFDAAPLTRSNLKAIPKDAAFALAARLDAAKLYKELVETTGRIEPRAQQELLGGVSEFEKQMKVKLYDDLLQSLGDTWRIYASPSEGNLVFTGLTAVVDIRDQKRLVAANAKLVLGSLMSGMAGAVKGQGGRSQPLIRRIKCGEHGEQTIFNLTPTSDFMPFSPSWCITENEMVFALYPQNVKAYLERAKDIGAESLADVAAVNAQVEENKPIAVSYLDTPAAFKLAYPIVQVFLAIASSEMGRGGPVLDSTLLPPAPSIGRHLRPSVTSVSLAEDGVVLESHQTLPIGGVGGLTVLPALMWFWVAPMPGAPRLGVGMLPTQMITSINNMKQLGLGLLNYHDTMNAFPATAAGQKPKQPPVSWRVLILPYVEQDALYKQYHFDEPWDSENNKKLIPLVPKVFSTPGSKKAADGKTNYLAVVGDAYALAADKGHRLAMFTDGTSNTILLVEASDEKAVPWTKPEDFTPDKTKPITGLVGLRRGAFLALAADGAGHVVPGDVDAATLNALFTRAGGEPVSFPEAGAAPAVDTQVVPSEAQPANPVTRPPQTGKSSAPAVAPVPEKPVVRPPGATHK
jgi:hypothetical protein